MNPQTEQTDAQALHLAHSIALQESSKDGKTPDYNAVGDAGTSHGAYQWQPGNFEAAAKKYGLNPSDFSPENQDKVAYKQVKEYKDRGYQPAEIASLWNSGSPHNYENHSGTTTINGKQIHYDTPKYVQGVKSYYTQLNGGQTSQPQQSQGYNPKPFSQPDNSGANQFLIDTSGQNTTPAPATDPSQGSSFMDKLQSRSDDANNALKGTFSGQVDPVSGLLQTAGAAGGALTDVATPIIGGVNKAADFLTGGYLGKLEGAAGDVIGQGVKTAANTDFGKTTMAGVNAYEQEHPTLTKDIGAVGNIAGGIGVLTGAGALKDAAGGLLGKAFAGAGEKAATNELGEVASRTVGGRKIVAAAEDQGLTSPVKVLAKKEFTPAIENGKYATQNASEKLDEAISNIDDNELQPLLDKANSPAVSQRIPLAQYRQEALAEAKDQLMDEGGVNNLFDRIQAKYGDYPTLSDMNKAKRLVSKRISESAFGSDVQSAGKLVRSSLQKSVEDGAKALDLGDVSAINDKMASLIKAQKLLKTIEGKAAKSGLLGKILREGVVDASTVAGEAMGNASGIPFAGALAGRGAGGLLSKVVSRKTVGGLLGRFAK